MTDHYSNGHLPAANLTIVAMVEEGRTLSTTKYLVRMDCCKTEQIMQHGRIRERMRCPPSKCKHCRPVQTINNGSGTNNHVRKEPTDFLNGPTWPVPGKTETTA